MRGIFSRRKKYGALEPDEIFLDAKNLPSFDTSHLEGRIERPLSERVYRSVLVAAALIGGIFIVTTFYLSVVEHTYFDAWASENHLRHNTLIAERGLVTDRNGLALAANTVASSSEVMLRSYPFGESAAHLVGYVSYPKRDQNGYWYQDETLGIAGVEALYNTTLRGENGVEIVETSASGDVVSGSTVHAPIAGRDVVLSIDADLQEAIYGFVKERVDAAFVGGAAAIMDIESGELLSLVSYPSFNPTVMSSGVPKETVQSYVNDPRAPFVDRGVVGLYTPGSIVKPFLAAAALEEGVVTPGTVYVSTGQLVVPNPYDPKKPTIFRDWRAHGAVDLREAIAVSSDVYFYILGGGFEDKKGLGISALDRYAALFGFGEQTGFPLEEEPSGTVPSPSWKADRFEDSVWRVGDTYNTAIGQYGWQVTLLQSVRATAALANGGVLLTPTILKGDVRETTSIPISEEHLAVAREGMRLAVTEGTAQALAIPGVRAAAKTGTAETGARKEYTNSLIIGFFPYDAPRYAFAVILERAKAGTTVGAPAVMQRILTWIRDHRPDMVDASLRD